MAQRSRWELLTACRSRAHRRSLAADNAELRAMAKLIYAAITSLDGYVEDAEGKFD
jgi:hypothetical protein